MKKILLKIIMISGISVGSILLIAIIINLIVILSTVDKIVEPHINSDAECIVILGCSVKRLEVNGEVKLIPSDMLNDRLEAAVPFIKANPNAKIIVSGDKTGTYDEPGTMARELVERFGVDESRIIKDNYGFCTNDSIQRAVKIYGYKKIIVVTQRYHLYRSMYIAMQLGAEVNGIDGALRKYAGQPIYSIREIIARSKDFIFVLFGIESYVNLK